MSTHRLFLKLDKTEHKLLNVTKRELSASSYKELIMTLLNGEYIDYLCNSTLTEKALRRILANLHQIENGYIGEGDIKGLIEEIEDITSELVIWNNSQIKPLFDNKGTVHEVQIRLSGEDKALVSSAKSATGFRTYGDLVIHLCYSYLSGNFNLPTPVDFSLFNDIGIEINKEARAYNTSKSYDRDNLDKALESLYELIIDLKDCLIKLGGKHVSEH